MVPRAGLYLCVCCNKAVIQTDTVLLFISPVSGSHYWSIYQPLSMCFNLPSLFFCRLNRSCPGRRESSRLRRGWEGGRPGGGGVRPKQTMEEAGQRGGEELSFGRFLTVDTHSVCVFDYSTVMIRFARCLLYFWPYYPWLSAPSHFVCRCNK